jgi:hypothetical protein
VSVFVFCKAVEDKDRLLTTKTPIWSATLMCVCVCVYRANIAHVDAGVLLFGHLAHDKRQALRHLVRCVTRNLPLSDGRYEEANGEVGGEARTGGVLVYTLNKEVRGSGFRRGLDSVKDKLCC